MPIFWMRGSPVKRKLLTFLPLILVQVLILAGLVASRQYRLTHGVKVRLPAQTAETVGQSLRDEISLVYDISRLNADKLPAGDTWQKNKPVYVTLGRGETGWQPLAFSHTEPHGVLFIKGRAEGPPAVKTGWEVELQLPDGSRRLLTPSWFSFVPGDEIVACLDLNNTPRHMDRVDSGGDCWNKEWTKVAGRVETVRQTGRRYLPVQYGIERYQPGDISPDILKKLSGSRSLQVEVSIREDGSSLVSRLIPP